LCSKQIQRARERPAGWPLPLQGVTSQVFVSRLVQRDAGHGERDALSREAGASNRFVQRQRAGHAFVLPTASSPLSRRLCWGCGFRPTQRAAAHRRPPVKLLLPETVFVPVPAVQTSLPICRIVHSIEPSVDDSSAVTRLVMF